ncbi:hypothetical protein [Oceanicella sp. SM1341]|uniref:hypothetical protein n=1 Tax=Oceanicella sp. SM1341 TaxID=1548889 RepID=UPI000E4E2461|nr:hypothetical protein [Oceanicella sp. SM1341]
MLRHLGPVLLGASLFAGPAAAQVTVPELREAFRNAARETDLVSGLLALTVFGATPGISTATFDVDDGDEFSTYRISPSRAFDAGFTGARVYLEGSLGYLAGGQGEDISIEVAEPTRVGFDFTTFSALGGAGLEFDLAQGTVLRPILLAGYSYTDVDAEFSGPEAGLLSAAGKGILWDAHLHNFIFGGALALQHDESFAGDLNLQARMRYTHYVARSFSATDSVLVGTRDFGVLVGAAELDGPTGLNVVGRQLRWIGFTTGTFLPGRSDALGFNYFVELGGGLELVDPDMVSGVEGVSLRGSGLLGNGVYGWSLGLSLEF